MLKLRNKNFFNNLEIKFKPIVRFLKKKNIKGNILGGYYPYNMEADITKLLEKFEKKKYTISLPKIKKNSEMNFFQWSSKDPLLVNRYGIPEPISNKLKHPDILLIPLLAFDNDFNRIGYGGGFYDRYIHKIQKFKKITKIGIAYSFQKVKKIPIDNHDIKLDFIFTEKNKN